MTEIINNKNNGGRHAPYSSADLMLAPLDVDGKLFYDPNIVDRLALREVTETLDREKFFFSRARVDLVREPELRTTTGDWLVGAAAIKAYFESE